MRVVKGENGGDSALFLHHADGSCSLKCSRTCEGFLFLTLKPMAVDCFGALPTLDIPVTIAAGQNDTTPASVAGHAPAIAERLKHGRLEM